MPSDPCSKPVEEPAGYTTLIRDLPADERPRERLLKYGPEALSAAELLAIMLRTGVAGTSALGLATRILKEFGTLRGVATASVEALARVSGLGPAKAAQLKAAFELGKRNALFVDSGRPRITSPQDVAALMLPEMAGQMREHFCALLLDARNQVLRVCTVSIGGLDSSIVHPREVFREAVTHAAASVIVAHNHPSGDPAPSPEDVAITKRLVEAGKVMGVSVLDHVILGDGRYVSLKERGIL